MPIDRCEYFNAQCSFDNLHPGDEFTSDKYGAGKIIKKDDSDTSLLVEYEDGTRKWESFYELAEAFKKFIK